MDVSYTVWTLKQSLSKQFMIRQLGGRIYKVASEIRAISWDHTTALSCQAAQKEAEVDYQAL